MEKKRKEGRKRIDENNRKGGRGEGMIRAVRKESKEEMDERNGWKRKEEENGIKEEEGRRGGEGIKIKVSKGREVWKTRMEEEGQERKRKME